MRRRTILLVGLVLVGIGIAGGITMVRQQGEPARLTLGTEPQPGEPTADAPDAQWGRPQVTGDPEHSPPTRADWSDEPDQWELHPVADVREIPLAVRSALEPLDCAIPGLRSQTLDSSVVWGEFERPGQRDLAVLCVHADKTSATYVFWAADPRRRDVMPRSGSGINTATPADMRVRLDPESPREPDMPAALDHDGLEIGCCECCSTIYYRHGGQWFTLPGAD